MILNKLMVMFVSQFYNKILWQSDHASVFLVCIYMNQSIPAAVVMIILINNQLDIFFSSTFSFAASFPENRGPFCTVQQEFCLDGLFLIRK